VEAARVGLVELPVLVADAGPLVQEAVGAVRLAERRQGPVRAVAALRGVALQLTDLLLRGAHDNPLVLPALPEQPLQPVA